MSTPIQHEITFRLPRWVAESVADAPALLDDDARMDLVLDLARTHVRRETGGPFAAAIVDGATGQLLSVGVNLVVPAMASVAHAEVVALALAGQAARSYDLSRHRAVLVTSTEPCAMCLGAVPWSGVSRVVCGARDEDARAVGFDEGDKPADWMDTLQRRGIEVARDVRRAEAASVLREYAENGGDIYNPAPGQEPR